MRSDGMCSCSERSVGDVASSALQKQQEKKRLNVSRETLSQKRSTDGVGMGVPARRSRPERRRAGVSKFPEKATVKCFT